MIMAALLIQHKLLMQTKKILIVPPITMMGIKVKMMKILAKLS